MKDTDVTNVLADVHASQYSAALKKGMRDLVEEYDPYILLKVRTLEYIYNIRINKLKFIVGLC